MEEESEGRMVLVIQAMVVAVTLFTQRTTFRAKED